MIKVLLITPEGKHQVTEMNPTLKNLQTAVGGYIEMIMPLPSGKEWETAWHAYCNEEGKLQHLPLNPLATALARTFGWASSDYLVGNVIFMGELPQEPFDTDVPKRLISWVEDVERSGNLESSS